MFPIEIPPLRERREDIPLLALFFVAKSSARIGKSIFSIPQKAMDVLVSYEWPGNVRELQNVIERSVILSPGDSLRVGESLGRARATPGRSAPSLRQDLKEIERDRIRRVLDTCDWRIKGDGHAADRLGLKPSTLRSRMQRLGIKRP